MTRYIAFFSVVVVCVGLDLWTKSLAEENLASVTRRWDHPIERTVAAGPTTVGAWVDQEFGPGVASADPPLVAGIFRLTEGAAPEGPLQAAAPIQQGDVLSVQHRQVEIVPGFWNHVYVQNFGAAWGFLSNKDERFVRPFFLVVAVIAVGVVFGLFRNARPEQRLLQVALPFIVGGALGNFIDRARYGYVVDFIDWYVTAGGAERHWPTFNVADVWITIGVALMILEILLTKEPSKPAAEAPEAEPSSRSSAPAVR